MQQAHFEYLKEMLKLLEIVIVWLEEHWDKDQEKIQKRRKKYLYALNLYLYGFVFAGKKEDLDYADRLAEELNDAFGAETFWQNRFADTLAWYEFRRAFLSDSEEDYKFHLDAANTQIDLAIKKYSNATDLHLFKVLKQKIKRHQRLSLNEVRARYQF